MKTLTLVMLLLLVACGKGDGPEQKDPNIDGKQKDAFMTNCVSEATRQGVGYAIAFKYCDCVLKEALKRYTLEDVEKKGEYEIMNELLKDGTIDRCSAEAVK